MMSKNNDILYYSKVSQANFLSKNFTYMTCYLYYLYRLLVSILTYRAFAFIAVVFVRSQVS